MFKTSYLLSYFSSQKNTYKIFIPTLNLIHRVNLDFSLGRLFLGDMARNSDLDLKLLHGCFSFLFHEKNCLRWRWKLLLSLYTRNVKNFKNWNSWLCFMNSGKHYVRLLFNPAGKWNLCGRRNNLNRKCMNIRACFFWEQSWGVLHNSRIFFVIPVGFSLIITTKNRV